MFRDFLYCLLILGIVGFSVEKVFFDLYNINIIGDIANGDVDTSMFHYVYSFTM